MVEVIVGVRLGSEIELCPCFLSHLYLTSSGGPRFAYLGFKLQLRDAQMAWFNFHEAV